MTDSINILYTKYLECSGVCIDTRKINKGDLFFALKGSNFDGNQYAKQALDNGAKYAVVDDPKAGVNTNFIQVDNVLETLQQLATFHRNHFTGHVLAITGSNGKTTTKELITRVLDTSFRVQSTVGNLNNHIGVPLTLLAMDSKLDIAIVEMGANHLGEIALYCEIAKPTHGVITNIGTAHIGEFGGRDNLIRAKSELFDYLLKNNGVGFVNKEDEVLYNMSKRFESPIFFPAGNCTLKNTSPFVEYQDKDGTKHQTHLVGKHNFMNASAALAIAGYFNADMSKAYEAIDSYAPDNNRSQVMKIGSNTIILDAYNANPDSTKAALDYLSSFENTKKIALLGDMKELGAYSQKSHCEIVDSVKSIGISEAFFVGEEYQKAATGKTPGVFSIVSELISFLKENPISDSTVLIKGSRSMTMEKLIETKEIWN
ncbi:UDP-N-acetylmuramoyl-tripeptide--D-alanyl-D-alanine ligase [Reichenbachiella sp. MALMAid0571]|uniref:UDP-N-acetylmuramoyl-tripeptide--D-alanyl-D- alanine ligase n=1 Tax=Reichenbachiella sp. MALMAid0571 TaxID=3143939 RepID=UPI0032DE7B8B